MSKTAVVGKGKKERTPQEQAALNERMAKIRAARKPKQAASVTSTHAIEEKTEAPSPLTVSPPEATVIVKKHSWWDRLWGIKPKQTIPTVAAFVADKTSITENPIAVVASKLPPDATKHLYGDRKVFFLTEVNDNSEIRYENFRTLDPKSEEETKLPPEELGMATDWPEAKTYYVQAKNQNEKLNMWLAIGLLLGLGILFFLVFTVGMGG